MSLMRAILCSPDDAHAMEYRRVFVKGRFDHSKEMYLGPKSRVAANENQDGGLIGSSGNVGYFVITPLELSDSGQRILVNRDCFASAVSISSYWKIIFYPRSFN